MIVIILTLQESEDGLSIQTKDVSKKPNMLVQQAFIHKALEEIKNKNIVSCIIKCMLTISLHCMIKSG